MDRSIIKTNMKKATVELLLLKLLSEGDKYGYQMTQELKKRSGGQYSLLEGSMYPILYRLQDQGLIIGIERKVGKRLTRVYYHLEPDGEVYYRKLQEEFAEYVSLLEFLLQSKEGECYEQKEVH